MNWAIFVSGQGSNLQAVLELEKEVLRKSKFEIVVADRECLALARAKTFAKRTVLLSPKDADFQLRLIQSLRDASIDGILLLGYMRILKPEFLREFWGPIINLHPSLLPKFKGARAIEDAYEAGEWVFGASLHHVVEAVDAGQVIRQISFRREPEWSFEELKEQVHLHEREMVRRFLIDLEENPSIVQD